MSGTSGPCSTLPGSSHSTPDGAMCDDHPDRPAAKRVQGETDSFGAEYYDLCQECVDEFKKSADENRNGKCDWCKCDATDLRDRRDYDEGMAGRVYRVCGACVKRSNERLQEEYDDDDDDYDDYDDYDYDDDGVRIEE